MLLKADNNSNKKILLRERKRHTARHVASAHYADLLGGYSVQSWTGGTPSFLMGVPPISWMGFLPSRPGMGYPPISWMGYPHLTWDGVPSPKSRRMGYPQSAGWGTPPSSSGMGTPHQLDGVPPPKVEQTHTCENITSHRTTYAGGNETHQFTLRRKLKSSAQKDFASGNF